MELIIGNSKVSENSKTIIIAEAGINHDGNYEQALKLIDVASEAGADVVKFQLFKANKMYSEKAGNYTTASGVVKPINMILKESELPENWIPKLQDYCREKKIGFLCTVCDEDGGDVLNEYQVDSFKMASYAITHLPLLQHVAHYQKPVIFSSAGAYLSDVDIAIRTIRETGNNKIALMHCVAKYPTPLEECNLNIIKTFKLAFPDLIIGYSDHTAGAIEAPVTAVICGAKIIEKHFTIDKNLPGADHSFSLNPEELKQMCKAIREVEVLDSIAQKAYICESALGTSEKTVRGIEEELRMYAYRCIFAIEDLNPGDVITKDNCAILRPGNMKRGLEPSMYSYLLDHKIKITKRVNKGEAIQWESILTD